MLTHDEREILFDNRKRPANWWDPSLALKKYATVWWSSAVVIDHIFLPNEMSDMYTIINNFAYL